MAQWQTDRARNPCLTPSVRLNSSSQILPNISYRNWLLSRRARPGNRAFQRAFRREFCSNFARLDTFFRCSVAVERQNSKQFRYQPDFEFNSEFATWLSAFFERRDIPRPCVLQHNQQFLRNVKNIALAEHTRVGEAPIATDVAQIGGIVHVQRFRDTFGPWSPTFDSRQ